MIRLTVFSLFFAFLAAYAWRDWYKALCGLILTMAIIRHPIMPSAMFGIIGLTPWNIVLLMILGSFVVNKSKENIVWDLSTRLNVVLLLTLTAMVIAISRGLANLDQVNTTREVIGTFSLSSTEIIMDNGINAIRYLIPCFLLFMGCTTRERLYWAVGAVVGLYLILALLTIRWMPLGLLTDGEALQKRAARVLVRDIGYYRTNLSVMLAGGFWIMVGYGNYFTKYRLICFGLAGITLLGMLLTGGRGGWLAWGVLSAFMVTIKWPKYLLAAPIVIMLALPFVPSSVYDRVTLGLGGDVEESLEGEDLNDDEAQMATVSAGRTLVWPKIIAKIKERPLVGWGLFGVTTSGITRSHFVEYSHVFFHPHNAYLQLLMDHGVLLSLPFFILFATLLKLSFKYMMLKDDPEKALAGIACFSTVFVFLVASITGQSFYPAERAFGMWCTIGILLRAHTGLAGVKSVTKSPLHTKPPDGLRSSGPTPLWSRGRHRW